MSLSMTIFLLLTCSVISIAAQLCLKVGVGRTGSALKSPATVWRASLQPMIWTGAILYASSTFIWIKILTVTDLSFAYPFAAVAYSGGVLMSMWTLKEKVTLARWVGLALVALGVGFVASTG